MVTILNTSILTDYGLYSYNPISLELAKYLAAEGFESAVGHQATATIISTLLGISCPVNRVQYKQAPRSQALVFKLNSRVEEGRILSTEEIEEIGYSWSLLERLA